MLAQEQGDQLDCFAQAHVVCEAGADTELVKLSRLSVAHVRPSEWDHILRLAGE
jgi:predicted RNA-binding protein with PUA-like domain